MGHHYQRELPARRKLRRSASELDEAQLLTKSGDASPVIGLQRTIGNQAVMRLLHSTAEPGIQRESKTQPEIGIKPVDVKPVRNDEMTGAELAQDIMNRQLAILEGWDTALENFRTVMTSSSDKAGKPNFKNVLLDFIEDKIVGELFKRAEKQLPGVSDTFALFNKMGAELKRANEAKSSASLRDFYVIYRKAIGNMRKLVLDTSISFVAKVRIAEENAVRSQEKADAYGMLRMELDSMLTALQAQSNLSTSDAIYRLLTEQWLRDSQVDIDKVGWRASYIFIRLEEDHTVRDAHIYGTGGQKLAEQLVKDSPEGIDPYSMKVPRLVYYFKGEGRGASTVLRVDEHGVVDKKNSAGNYTTLHERLERQGLKPTTKFEGE